MNNTTVVINETLVNATSQADIGTAATLFFTVVIPAVLERFFTFVAAPFLHPEMWWLLVHLVLTFALFEFYFERHRKEELGWSAALANSVVMIFISTELLRSLYEHVTSPLAVGMAVFSDMLTIGPFTERTFIIFLVLLLGALGIATAAINYFHLLPRFLAFLVSGHKTVNGLAYFLIVIVWRFNHGTPMPIDIVTLVGFALFLLLIGSVLFFMTHKVAHKHDHKKHKRFKHGRA